MVRYLRLPARCKLLLRAFRSAPKAGTRLSSNVCASPLPLCINMSLLCSITGIEFERRILGQEAQNVKFNFLQQADPYHAYYRLRVGGGGMCLFL